MFVACDEWNVCHLCMAGCPVNQKYLQIVQERIKHIMQFSSLFYTVGMLLHCILYYLRKLLQWEQQ